MAEEAAPAIHGLGLTQQGWEQSLAKLGQPAWRARQTLQWIHQKGVLDPEQMTDLPQELRQQLSRDLCFEAPTLSEVHRTPDGVVRFLTPAQISGGSGDLVEAVLIPAGRRLTLCVSSQAGCALGCVFCETGRQGFAGNLSTAAILGQLWLARFHPELHFAERQISNVVFMGMGEPMLNLAAVEGALSVMFSDYGYGLAKKRVTISTAGVIPGIQALNPGPTLALSLHAADDELRNRLVPIGRKYPLAEVLSACRGYLKRQPGHTTLTVEYTLLRDINDSPQQANALADLLQDLPCKVNLIPCNPVPTLPFLSPDEAVMDAFCARLAARSVVVTLRRPRGLEVSAACGQLAGRLQSPVGGQRRMFFGDIIAADSLQTTPANSTIA